MKIMDFLSKKAITADLKASDKEGVIREMVDLLSDLCERVNQFVAGGGADLDEADFFGVGMKTVGLGIECEPGCGFDCGQECSEFCVGVNHTESIKAPSVTCQVLRARLPLLKSSS